MVGSVPWWKVREADRSLFIYDNIAKWDDSAGEEAFKNAKARFWAKINDLPCCIPLPDPNIYIDDVDWDAEVDTELILDLERDSEASGGIMKNEHVVILDSSILFGPYTGIGWGSEWEDDDDAENGNKNKVENHCGDQNFDGRNDDDSWGRDKNGSLNHINDDLQRKNSWEQNFGGWNGYTWGRDKNGSWNHISNGSFHPKNTDCSTENAWEQNFGGWNDGSWGKERNNDFQQRTTDYGNGRNWGRSDWNGKMRSEGLEEYAPGFKSSEDHSEDWRWRNRRGRRRGSYLQHPNNWFWTLY